MPSGGRQTVTSAAALSDVMLRTTLQLPKTVFPMRANASVREPSIQQRITSDVYNRQLKIRSTFNAQTGHTKPSKEFILHDGPPYANGKLHIGHLLNKVLKDIINRQALMEGRNVRYVPGWDCHGLPIELKALEKFQEESGKSDALDGCSGSSNAMRIRRLAAQHATETIEDQAADFARWGVLADWSGELGSSYRTMNRQYEAMQLEVFRRLLENGFIYRGEKPVYWSPSTKTALAEAELEYQDNHISTAAYVGFPLIDPTTEMLDYPHLHQTQEQSVLDTLRSSIQLFGQQHSFAQDAITDHGTNIISAMIWTTTPWTIPANVAICIDPDATYTLTAFEKQDMNSSSSLVQNRFFLVAEALQEQLVQVLQESNQESTIHAHTIHTIQGNDLVGFEFAHPLKSIQGIECNRNSIVLPGSHVTIDSGTGLVHTAPGHGHDDWNVIHSINRSFKEETGAAKGGQKGEQKGEAKGEALGQEKGASIPILCPVEDDGTFSSSVGDKLQGKDIFNSGNQTILELLSNSGKLIHSAPYSHRYPYDWRSKQPVIIRATSQWFVQLDNIIEPCQEIVSQIQLYPETGRNRLSTMLGNRSEWCISRQRAWGVPIPVLYHRETGEPCMNDETLRHIIDIIADRGSDAWWTSEIHELLPCNLKEQADQYERGMDTLDVWFDSGSSWASAWAIDAGAGDGQHTTNLRSGWTSTDELGKTADVVLEGSDQHRGWFQSSLLTSMAVQNKAPYRTIITHGFVLDEHSRKMSKSLGNTVAPGDIIDGKQTAAKTTTSTKKNVASQKKQKSKKKQSNMGFSTPYGVDVARWWVGSTDYSRDVIISPEIISKASESLRKVRNTARFILGNLREYPLAYNSQIYHDATFEKMSVISSDSSETSHDLVDMYKKYLSQISSEYGAISTIQIAPWMQHAYMSPLLQPDQISPFHQFALWRLAVLEKEVADGYANYNFARVVSAISNFVVRDLSSLYLEFTKDRLYANHTLDKDRQTTQAILWECLVSLTLNIAPIACFTAEDIFQHASTIALASARSSVLHKSNLHSNEDTTNDNSTHTTSNSSNLSSSNEEGTPQSLPSFMDPTAKIDRAINPITNISLFDCLHRPCPEHWNNSTDCMNHWTSILAVRNAVNTMIEKARSDKLVGSPLDLQIRFDVSNTTNTYIQDALQWMTSHENSMEADAHDIFGTSHITVDHLSNHMRETICSMAQSNLNETTTDIPFHHESDPLQTSNTTILSSSTMDDSNKTFMRSYDTMLQFKNNDSTQIQEPVRITISNAEGSKCRRCWKVSPYVSSTTGHLCERCTRVVEHMLQSGEIDCNETH